MSTLDELMLAYYRLYDEYLLAEGVVLNLVRLRDADKEDEWGHWERVSYAVALGKQMDKALCDYLSALGAECGVEIEIEHLSWGLYLNATSPNGSSIGTDLSTETCLVTLERDIRELGHLSELADEDGTKEAETE